MCNENEVSLWRIRGSNKFVVTSYYNEKAPEPMSGEQGPFLKQQDGWKLLQALDL